LKRTKSLLFIGLHSNQLLVDVLLMIDKTNILL